MWTTPQTFQWSPLVQARRHDLRYALRALRGRPALAIAAVLTTLLIVTVSVTVNVERRDSPLTGPGQTMNSTRRHEGW
jgi:hypothetical protein